ncbi:TRAF3-interacting JNK-activating modulator isoform X1 [Rhinatrema bivittatum]|uniref:TRAF3-interacting JNK-activating modulator isoform X1 n=2 Tax=Rhinatrema bivittatum TaxID=194408 RepID=UPI0011290737|nr:TRAF3-interacting JNK-activating modulator isoform X1 [Rhinatrema bivittatum]XP_029429926.1 TRAF3-interacting JNK-activating modulator isoform X1 [Rhinatrema bivittatum]XP_029429927.1 TRAF3-interacting JNK-activating modulator isoform X1 [Rhinatrema bivittatum]
MINKSARSPQHQQHLLESYNDKWDRRLVTHEILRSRVNVTSCRHVGKSLNKEPEKQVGSPRQQEFFRRRNLSTGDKGIKIRSPCRKTPSREDIPKKTTWTYLGSSVVNQLFQDTNNSLFSYQYAPRTLNDVSLTLNSHPSGTSHMEQSIKVLKGERGTQTAEGSSMHRIRIMRDSSQQTDCGTAVLDKEIFQLSDYLKEALQRERKLKQKLAILQELLAALVRAAEKSWKVQVNEDRLKSRVGALESQLDACSQNLGKEGVKKILMEMEEQKQKYEQEAKKSIQKILKEKGMAEQALQNTQRMLVVTEGERGLWKEEYEAFKKEWSDLTARNVELQNELYVLQGKLECVDTQDAQLQKLQAQLYALEGERTELQTRLDVSQEDNELKEGQLTSMNGRWRNAEDQKRALELTISQLQNEVFTMRSQLCSSAIQRQHPSQSDEADQKYRAELQKVMSRLEVKEKECMELRSELEALSDEYHSCQMKLRQCREQLKSHQGKRRTRRSCCCWWCWLPLLVLVIAMALATFLTNMDIFRPSDSKKQTPF